MTKATEEIKKAQVKVDQFERQLVEAKEGVEYWKRRAKKEAAQVKCPMCGNEELSPPNLPYDKNHPMTTDLECAVCETMIKVTVAYNGMDEFEPTSYEKKIQEMGPTFQGQHPKDLDNQKLERLIQYLSGLGNGRTSHQNMILNESLDLKTRRLKLVDTKD